MRVIPNADASRSLWDTWSGREITSPLAGSQYQREDTSLRTRDWRLFAPGELDKMLHCRRPSLPTSGTWRALSKTAYHGAHRTLILELTVVYSDLRV